MHPTTLLVPEFIICPHTITAPITKERKEGIPLVVDAVDFKTARRKKNVKPSIDVASSPFSLLIGGIEMVRHCTPEG